MGDCRGAPGGLKSSCTPTHNHMQDAFLNGEKVRALALQRAIDAFGSSLALCAFLDITPAVLMAWISGEVPVPEATFLRLVDLALDGAVRPISDPVAVLKKARELAGGVTFLGRRIGVGASQLDRYLHGQEPVPETVFRRALDFLSETSTPGYVPPGFPASWREGDPA
jgi:hypothetical protein